MGRLKRGRLAKAEIAGHAAQPERPRPRERSLKQLASAVVPHLRLRQSPLLAGVARVDQGKTSNLARIPLDKEAGHQAAKRMPDQHIRRAAADAAKKGMKLPCHRHGSTLPRRRIAPPKPCPVIHTYG